MNHDLPASLRTALHRVDSLSPLAPPSPPVRTRPVARRRPGRRLAVATVAMACVATAAMVAVVVSDPWSDPAAEARYAVVETPEGTAMYLPASIPDGYELVAAQRLVADPAERGDTILTGRIEGDTITEWVSAATSPDGLSRWFNDGELETVTTPARSYRSVTIDGEAVLDFATDACGVVTVTAGATAAGTVAIAADRIGCDDGGLTTELRPDHELLYAGPRNTAPDDGLVLTYAAGSPDAPTVRLHLRRIGFPPELASLSYDGGPEMQTVDDKQVTITRADDMSAIAWSFPPDHLIVLSSQHADATDVLTEFLDELIPATTVDLRRACASVGTPDCT